MAKHKLPQTFERYVEAVHDVKTGQLLRWRVSVDIVPGRIGGLKPGQLVKVTIEKRKAGK